FDTDWTGYDSETTYWLGQRGAATITLVGDEFVWPGNVEPEAAMYLIGSFNNWDQDNMLAMTKDANGKWVVTQEMAENAEFKFRNENGDWFGGVTDGNNFILTEELVGNELELSIPGMNFQIPVAGTWTFTLDPDAMKLVIDGEWPETPVEPTKVYILGELTEQAWAANAGLEMATEDNNIFTAEIDIDGRNEGYNYFSFTTKLADNADDWNAIAPYRFGAVSEGDFDVTEEMLGIELSLTYENGQAYKIPTGKYELTLNLETMKLVITKNAPALKVGDVNGDGLVDVADVSMVIDVLLENILPSACAGNPDVNGDGTVDVDDVNALINIILAQ
ncbi:MAG: SusF/SusE family outer membrane protein, partial [Muribaculaceae bacterium]|nr:SusF/SusE family outer membrane protein [Muribaculaceae bacterium]